MKAVILAGGLGSRLSEETSLCPKPMVEIGGKPMLWHIMKIYSAYGIHDFIICLGYKGFVIKQYFANYLLHLSDATIDLAKNTIELHRRDCEPWKITLVETGVDTMTGGRLKRILPYIQEEEMVCMTYGDGVADVNLAQLIQFHREHKRLVTMTATQPQGQFGIVEIGSDGIVQEFTEKPKDSGRWINGGFFVLSPKALARITGDSTIWEREPLETLAKDGQVAAFKHHGFWHAMDTLHDRKFLEERWAKNEAPWKVW